MDSKILKITREWESFFRSEIEKDKLQNVYLYIDTQLLGFENEGVESYVVTENGEVSALLYIYYSSIQLFCVRSIGESAAKLIARFMEERNIKRASGRTDAIDAVGKFIPCTTSAGHIMEYTGKDCPEKSDAASFCDLPEIVRLICNDSHLGQGYTYENLLLQMERRMTGEGCKSRVIRQDGKIVSHFATFAVMDDIAVLSGMVTDPDYRNRGLGSILVRDLSNEVKYRDNKLPILYCYQDEYYTWYRKLGYETVGECSKLDVKQP